MTDQDTEAAVLARRNLIRGGAVLAGAAGLTAVGAALAPKASATDGSGIIQGQANAGAGAATTTGISITNTASTTAPLTLTHANTQAPQLALSPRVPFPATAPLPALRPGEILNTELGPYIGLVGEEDGVRVNVTGFLTSNFDLDAKAEPVAVPPERVLNTQTAAGRLSIKNKSSSTAIDSSGRLTSGSWIDVVVGIDDLDYVIDGAFFNLTVTGTTGAGFLTAYPPSPTRPATSSLNFTTGAIVANMAFTQVILDGVDYLVRIYTNRTTHLLLDVTGYAQRGASAEPVTSARGTQRRRPSGGSFASRRVRRAARKR